MSCNQMNCLTLNDISIGKGSYGISASAVDYSSDLYTYLRITDINDDGTLNKEGLMSVNNPNSYKYILKSNDIVFARTGNSTGRSYFYDGSLGDIVYAGFLIKFSLDPQKVNPKYMKYYTLSKEYRDWVKSFSTGSTRGNINAKTYGEMKINLPSREQQNYTVEVLSSLDKKIELNNEMNKTLEEMAQALFKRWFVDFEFPNEEGKHYKSSGGEMVESEMGMIPKGWHVGCLADLVNIKYGKDHKKLEDGDIPVYGSGGIMRYVNKSLYEKESVLIPRKGTLNNVMYVNQPFWSVDTMFFTEMKLPNIAKFVYQFVKSKDLAKMNMGSAVPSMTTSILNSMKIVIPDKMNLQKFNEIVSTFYDKIEFNDNNTKNLIKVRDSLLPKLMNGEININNIEAIL